MRKVKLDLDQLQKLCDEATPGPWHATYDEYGDYGEEGLPKCGEGAWTVTADRKQIGWRTDGGLSPYGLTKEDAEFMAAAREAMPLLIAEVRRLSASGAECVR